jgi:DNA-binding NarL/FixJ family response regulator
MDTATSAEDMQAVLDAVRKVSTVDDLASFRLAALAAVRGLVPCDGAGYNEVDASVPSIVYVTDPDDYADLGPEPFAQRFARYAHEHPLLTHMQETGDGSARTISEFLTQDEFHALGLYRELYALMHVEYQVAMALPAPLPLVIAIVATREIGDFSARDRAVLDALRPHLIQAYRRAEILESMRDDVAAFAAAMTTPTRGVAIVDRQRALRFVDAASEARAARYGVDEASVAEWVDDERARLRTRPTPLPLAVPLVVDAEAGRLVLRFVPGRSGTDVVIMDERLRTTDAAVLEALGLTPREAQVLALLSEGATNGDIAERLGTSPGTVRKHLESVYRKLGVRNRTEATAATYETLAALDDRTR